MKEKGQLGARLVERTPTARELWLLAAFVVLTVVAVVTVLVPAIKNEHPNDDDGPAGAHPAQPAPPAAAPAPSH